MADVESLELQITGDAQSAKAGLDALIGTLDTLKTKTAGGCGLNAIVNPLRKIVAETSKLNGTEGANLEALARGLSALTSLGQTKISSSIANQISAMADATKKLDGTENAKLTGLFSGVQPLTTMGKSSLGTAVNQVKQYQNAISKLPASNQKATVSFANLSAKIVAAAYALKRGVRLVSSWIKESNDYTENLNLFTVAMGEYAGEAQKYAEHVGELMGIDPSEWMRSQGVFMTLATGFGVAGDRAATMSKNLTQLGYDLSSFYNISTEEAMQKLKSGFAGELEPLRNLGYDLSQAKLEAIALSLGIDKSVSSMTQAEKAQLRYYAIMTQVTQVQGDMARTLDAPANQLRILSAQLTQAARALGNIFIPLLNKVLPYLIAFAKVVRIVANAVASLFGYELPEMDWSGSLGDASSSTGDLSDSLEEATDNATKLRKTLLGIDELNVMSDASSGAGTGVDIGGGFDFDIPTYDFIGEATENRVNEIVASMKEWLGIGDDITSWADLMDTRFGNILTTVGAIGLAMGAWKISVGTLKAIETIKELAEKTGAGGAMTGIGGGILGLLGGFIEVQGIIDAVKNGLDGFNFAEILGGGGTLAGGAALLGKALGSALLGGAIGGILAGIPAFLMGIYDAIKNGIDWLSGALIGAGATAAGAGIGAIIGMLGGPVTAAAGALIGLAVGLITDGVILIVQKWDVILPWLQKTGKKIGNFFSDLWKNIQKIWKKVTSWFDKKVISPIVDKWEDFRDGVTTIVSDVRDKVQTIWEKVSSWFDEKVIQPIVKLWNNLRKVFSPVVQWFSELFGSVKQTLSDHFYNIGVIATGCWEVIKTAWAMASEFFSDLWDGIKTYATGVWDGIKAGVTTAWVGIKTKWEPAGEFFSGLWEGIKVGATAAWNGVTSFGTDAWEGVKTVWGIARDFFSGLWDGLVDKAGSAWEGVKTVFGNVASFFRTTFQNAWQGVVNVFSTAGEIFVNIKDGVLSAFKSVVNKLIDGINAVVAIPFKGINAAINKIKTATILGTKPFANLTTISVPMIPHLADGGVVDAGQLFVAREAGPELVANAGRKTAVMNNDQIVESVSRGVYQAVVAAMGSSRGDQVVEAKVNDKVLFEVMVSRARQETVRTGHNPLLGGV